MQQTTTDIERVLHLLSSVEAPSGMEARIVSACSSRLLINSHLQKRNAAHKRRVRLRRKLYGVQSKRD
jgi:hypothetical protein